ncbi:MAG: archaetidylinositol phosphate synthase [Candidatus Methanomethylicia archaeon]|jgi:archaetidylinositol phosphate synthase|nr:archaetidylinositol phosphate synthase [Candidatus Methanomethylicia archaeon]MCQ5374350.1 archaetidylinositol phosphate synthase [Candidatus Methanomethylicia archaeon]NHV60374.1 CDP-alcohol phosphatidyltransferase family protein [Candidatus Verstraetearchaeota archaeon]
MLNKVKERVSAAIKPIAGSMVALGLSPNHVTIIGFALSLTSAYAFFSSSAQLGGILLLLAGLFDVLDGAVARISGRVTKWGGVLDSTLDRYSDIAIISGIILGGLCDTFWGLLSIMGSVMVSYVRARGEVEGVKLSSVGLMERAERMVLIAVSALVGYTWAGIVLLAILTNITVCQRLVRVRASLRGL